MLLINKEARGQSGKAVAGGEITLDSRTSVEYFYVCGIFVLAARLTESRFIRVIHYSRARMQGILDPPIANVPLTLGEESWPRFLPELSAREDHRG